MDSRTLRNACLGALAGALAPAGAASGPATADMELSFWQSIEASEDAEEYTVYLHRYPEGAYAALAKLRLARLAGREVKTDSAGATYPDFWPPLWSTSGSCENGLGPFAKWAQALERYRIQRREVAAGRSSAYAAAPRVKRWRELLATLEGGAWRDRLARVNDFVNQTPFRIDVAWGVEDRWLTPYEFLVDGGDDEDYAIAKYLSLRELGFPAASLRIVAVQDLELRLPRAVLAVAVAGRIWLLDNQLAEVAASDDVARYRPIFSLDETAWCRHRPPP